MIYFFLIVEAKKKKQMTGMTTYDKVWGLAFCLLSRSNGQIGDSPNLSSEYRCTIFYHSLIIFFPSQYLYSFFRGK